MVHVVAVITTHPGKREELLAAFAQNVPAVHAEDGCIEYTGTVDAEGFGKFQAVLGPDTVIIIEKWASPDALKAHARTPHMAEYATKVKDLIAERAVHVLSAV